MRHFNSLAPCISNPVRAIFLFLLFCHGPVVAQLRQKIDCDCKLTGEYEVIKKGVAPYQNYGNSAESAPLYKFNWNGEYLSVIKNADEVEVYGLGPVPPGQPVTPLGFSPDQHRFLYYQIYGNKYYFYLVDLLTHKVLYSFETATYNLTAQFSASGRYFFSFEVVNNTGSDLVNLHFVDVETSEIYTESFGIASSAAAGGVAAWGFNQNKNNARTEAGFLYVWKNPQDNVEYRLLGLGQYPIKKSDVLPISGNGEYRFSPCGDVLGVSDLNGAALFSTLTGDRIAGIEMNYVNSFQCSAENHRIGDVILITNTADNSCSSGPADTEAPSWPPGTTLTVSDVSYTAMHLRWTAANDNTGVTGYLIFANDKQAGTVPGNTREYLLTNLTPSRQYEIKVEAVDGAGNRSQNGPHKSASTLSDNGDHYPPVWPEEALHITVTSESSVMLTWPAASDSVKVASYKIFLDDSPATSVAGDVLSAEITGLEKGKTYVLGVRAGDEADNWSTMLKTSLYFSDQALGITPDSILSKGIVFGEMAPGAVKYAYFSITNSGLSGQALALGSNNNRFKVSPGSLNLAPGETAWVTVTFSAGSSDSQESGKLTVKTGAATLMTIDLKATVKATRVLKVSETDLPFGTVEAGTECYRILLLSNEGNSTLSVQSIRASDVSFSVLRSGDFPATLPPGSLYSIDIVFKPVSTGVKSGFLYIESDADNDVAPLHLTGIGVAPHSAWVADKIYSGAMAPVIAVDQTGSNHILATTAETGDLIYLTDASGNWQNEILDGHVLYGSTAIACDAQGRLHICYATRTDSTVYYRVKEQGRWSNPEKVTRDYMWASAIAVDAAGNVHIGYMNVDGMAMPGLVKYAKKANDNWTVDSVTGAYDFASMAVNRAGIPYFAMYPYIRYTSRLQDGGWKPVNVIPSPAGSGQMEGMVIRIDIDRNQFPVITALAKKFMKTFRQDAEGHWSSEVISRIGFLTYGFDTETDASNNLHCSFYLSNGDYVNGGLNLFYWHSGSECSVLMDPSITYGGAVNSLNAMAIDSNGFIHIVYGTSGSDYQTYYLNYLTNDPAPGSASIFVYSGTENFGEVQKGDTLTAYFVIRNFGKAELEIYSIASSDSIFHPSVSSAVIPAKDSLVVRVAMAPPDSIKAGERNTGIVIRHNDGRKPDQVVVFKGTVIENPVIAVDRDHVSFGRMYPGETDSAALKISNRGKYPLRIDEIVASNGLFSTTPASATIAPGDSAFVTVFCRIPADAGGGFRKGTITISRELNFDTVSAEIPSVRQFYIENRGTDTLVVDRMDNGNRIFTVTPRSGRIAAADSLAVSVQCLPNAYAPAGRLMDSVLIAHNDTSQPVQKLLLAAYVLNERPVIEVRPQKVNFGSVSIFWPSAKEIIITNNGTQDVAIKKIQIGQDDNAFSVPVLSSRLIIKANQSYKLKVIFKPKKLKTYNAALLIDVENLPRSIKIDLTGRGTLFGF